MHLGERNFRLPLSLLTTIMVLFSGSCTIVNISSGDGAVRSNWYPGTVSVELEPSSSIQLVRTSGIGVLTTDSEVILGFHKAELAAVPDDCHLIVWIETKDQLKALRDLIGDASNLCVTGED